MRLSAEPTSPEEVAHLPPIEGLPAYSVKPPKGDDRDVWSDEHYHLWTVQLEDVVADDVREIWIGQQRLQGATHLTGRFRLKPLRAVDVGPIHVDLSRGDVSEGPRVIVDSIVASVDLEITRFDPRTTDTKGLLHHVSIGADVRARWKDLARMSSRPSFTLDGSLDLRRLVLQVKKGVIQEGSHGELGPSDVAIVALGHRGSGGLSGTFDVPHAGGAPRLALQAELGGARVARASAAPTREPVLRSPRLLVTGDSAELDLAAPFGDFHGVLDVPEGELPDVRELDPYVPSSTPLVLKGGSATVALRLEAWRADKRLAARASLRADDLDFSIAKLRVKSVLSAETSFASYRWDTHLLQDANLALHLARASLSSTADLGTPMIEVRGARITAHGDRVDLEDPLRTLDVALAVPDGTFVDRGLLRAYLPPSLALARLRRARFSLDGDLAVSEHLARGKLEARSSLGFDYHDLALTARVRARAQVHDWDWKRGDLALDRAMVDATGITVSRGSAAPGLGIDRISLVARSPRFSISDPLARVAFTGSFVGASVMDATVANELLPADGAIRLDANGAKLAGQIGVDITRHVARGAVSVSAQNIGLSAGGFRVRGDLELAAGVDDWRVEDDRMRVRGSSVLLTRVEGAFADHVQKDFSAERIELRASTPWLDLANPTLRGADLRLLIHRASLPDARSLGALLPEGLLSIESGSARLEADVDISSTERRGSGSVEVELKSSVFTIREARVGGDFHLGVKLRGLDAERPQVDLSGSRLQIRNVEVTCVTSATTRWEGDVVLEQATLSLTPEPTFDTRVEVRGVDASPVLAMLVGNDLPKHFVGLVRMPNLTATGRLTVKPGEIMLGDMHAHGGNVRIGGFLVSRGAHQRGAFVLAKGWLSVGLGLDDEGMGVHFFGLESWLRDEAHAVTRLRSLPVEASAPEAAPGGKKRARKTLCPRLEAK